MAGDGAGAGGPCGVGDADHAEHGHLRRGVLRGTKMRRAPAVQVGRSDLDVERSRAARAVIIGHHAFNGFAVAEFQAYPEPVQFWPAQKYFSFRLEVWGELAHKINGANFLERQGAVGLRRAVRRSMGSASCEARGIKVQPWQGGAVR